MDEPRLWHRAGGSGDATLLVLLHGLGANSRVFDGVIAEVARRWPGGWLAPDLAGHGASRWDTSYSFAKHADDIAVLLDAGRPLCLLGHSMGGVVALELARAERGLTIVGVVGLGIKVAWTHEELARAVALAERPRQRFASRSEAVDRFLRVSGLAGLVTADDPVVEAGVRRAEGGDGDHGGEAWELAMDPRGFGVGAPDLAGLLASTACPVVLARGERDPMVTTPQLQALHAETVEVPGLGHNAHVEDPAATLALALALVGRAARGGE
jgi:pimeloyl-ACP methyl ester carboxylesterase